MSASLGFTLPRVGTARIVRQGRAGLGRAGQGRSGVARLLGRGSAVPSTSAMAAAQSGDVAEFPLPGPEVVGVTRAGLDREADCAVSALYAERYRSLVRLAALLV